MVLIALLRKRCDQRGISHAIIAADKQYEARE
jgi:hypothetical protein